MFLTKECDYAIRVVRALAGMEKKSAKMICEREYIPAPFAYKILNKLEHAGIVCSYRGTLGGYQLAKKLDCITLFDVINAVDENLFINECLQPGHVCPHNTNGSRCSVHQDLERIQNGLIISLKEKTLDRFF